MRKLFLITTFAISAPILILLNIIAISYLSYQKNSNNFFQLGTNKQTVAYAALPPVQSVTEQEIIESDARVEIVRQFFAKYNSPLEPYAKDVVDTADAFGLDFRLIPSIAMQESNLCRVIPDNSYNCWGFGIYGGKITRFADYKEGIYTVTKTLANTYKKKGLETPSEIVKLYTPSDTGKWVNGVSHFMNQLQ